MSLSGLSRRANYMETHCQRIGDPQSPGQYAERGDPEIALPHHQSTYRNQALAAVHNVGRDSVLMVCAMEIDAYDYYGREAEPVTAAERNVRVGSCLASISLGPSSLLNGNAAALGRLIDIQAFQRYAQIKAAMHQLGVHVDLALDFRDRH